MDVRHAISLCATLRHTSIRTVPESVTSSRSISYGGKTAKLAFQHITPTSQQGGLPISSAVRSFSCPRCFHTTRGIESLLSLLVKSWYCSCLPYLILIALSSWRKNVLNCYRKITMLEDRFMSQGIFNLRECYKIKRKLRKLTRASRKCFLFFMLLVFHVK